MPRENALVGLVVAIEPPVESGNAAELLRENPDGVTIAVGDSQRARLVAGEGAAGRLEILDELRRMEQPVYLEVDPGTGVIVRLEIPLLARAVRFDDRVGEFRVEFDASHGRHRLDRRSDDFDSFRSVIEAAIDSRVPLLVTETDDDGIIDIRPWPHPPFPSDLVPLPVLPVPFWLRWWRWFWGWLGFCCWGVSETKANQLFAQMAATTCQPLTVPAPCIPFMFPDDGCWARAHEMCRLMLSQGVHPRKVWIDGALHTPTKNHPQCAVYWGWHVAPTLCVRRWWWWLFGRRTMVIDPSLFSGPVTMATWKGVQGDPAATLTPTSADVYWRNAIPTDPAYVDTNYRLNYYRLQLKNRSLGPNGPPPYAFC